MADKKVSDLPSLNGADVDPADLLYIVDSSAGAAGSKKITVGQYQLAPVSGGTANTVVYLNGSKVESSSSALTFDGTNLGIGTSSPAQKLQVNNSTAVNTYAAFSNPNATNGLYVGSAASGNGIVGTVDIQPLLFLTSAAERMRLDTSGNLGLGVTPSAWAAGSRALQLGASGYTALYQGSGGESNFTNNVYLSAVGTWTAVTSLGASRYQLDFGAHKWWVASSGTAGNAISFTQAMTLDANGDLGVGKTPSYRIDISAPLEDGTPAISLFNPSASLRQGYLAHNLGNLVIGNARTDSDYGQIIFAPRSTEAARITSGGNLLVGTTSDIASDAKLVAKNSTSATVTAGFWNSATSGDNLFAGFYTEATITVRGSISYNRAGGLVAYNTTSDYRAKDIIGPVQNPGATIDALKVYEGVMKGATQSRPMLVAHEAQAVAPYAVTGVKDEVNEDGTPKFQQIDVSSLVPLLLAEIQSLRARVAALEAK